jgi:hypothetical protein
LHQLSSSQTTICLFTVTEGDVPNLLWFEWQVDPNGYRFESTDQKTWRDPPEPHEPERLILVPDGFQSTRYHPLADHTALFRNFADVDPSPEGVQAFANRYGLLKKPEEEGPIATWYDRIRRMKNAVNLWEKGRVEGNMRPVIDYFAKGQRAVSEVRLTHVPGKKDPSLNFVPGHLLAAMWLQFGQAVSSSANLRSCTWCSTWFVFGTGTGRRKSAHFCSDNCRKASHRHERTGQRTTVSQTTQPKKPK